MKVKGTNEAADGLGGADPGGTEADEMFHMAIDPVLSVVERYPVQKVRRHLASFSSLSHHALTPYQCPPHEPILCDTITTLCWCCITAISILLFTFQKYMSLLFIFCGDNLQSYCPSVSGAPVVRRKWR